MCGVTIPKSGVDISYHLTRLPLRVKFVSYLAFAINILGVDSEPLDAWGCLGACFQVICETEQVTIHFKSQYVIETRT